MEDEKHDEELDEELDDGYNIGTLKNPLLASNDKTTKQSGGNYKLTLLPVKGTVVDLIQKCIGQIAISYDNEKDAHGDPIYRYGTGTVYKQITSKYFLIITCAHNLAYFNDEKQKKEKAKKIFFLPLGTKVPGKRLKCVNWIAHPDYDPNILHSSNDIGVILAYDPCKYYNKLNLDVNNAIKLDKYNRQQLKNCNVWGYPVQANGNLMGVSGGKAKEDKTNKEWVYQNIYTYPGQSGSPLYKESDEFDIYTIYGIHIFGDVDKQFNRAVKLNDKSLHWIQNAEKIMTEEMQKHKESRRRQKSIKTKGGPNAGFEQLLQSINCAKYYKNFKDRGVEYVDDVKQADSNELLKEFLITDYKDRKAILNGIKQYFIPKMCREKCNNCGSSCCLKAGHSEKHDNSSGWHHPGELESGRWNGHTYPVVWSCCGKVEDGSACTVVCSVCKFIKENRALDEMTQLSLKPIMLKRIAMICDKNSFSTVASLLSLDVDDLTKLNQKKGKKTADKVIQSVGSAMRKLAETEGIESFRFREKGDEFGMIILGHDKEQVIEIAKALKETIKKSTQQTVSIGIAIRGKNEEKDTWFDRAEESLKKAKKNGKNKIAFVETSIL